MEMNMSDIDEGRALALNGTLERPRRWLIAVLALTLLCVCAGLAIALSHATAQARIPPLFALGTAPLVILVALGLTLRSLNRARVYVDQGELVIKPGIGGKRIALAKLRRHGLSVVDLAERRDLRPIIKLMGTGLPGFSGGRYRLRNGETAVCLLLDRTRVSYLRSDDGLSVLLSLKEPERLREMLAR
jgi:hypothetical protein